MIRTCTLAPALLFATGTVQTRSQEGRLSLAVNAGLAQLYRSGEITEIFGRWFGALGDPGPVIRAVYLLGAIPE